MVVPAKNRVAILGVAVDNLTMNDVLDAIENKIAEGGFHQIATANADFLMRSIKDEELHETLCRCDYVLADGMPLVWASHLLGAGLKERVTGADLVPRLAELSACNGYRIFLLGASEKSSAGCAEWMEKNYPGVHIAGRYSPAYQPLEEMDHEDILARIDAVKPDILLVSFGNPKQEKWIAMHRHRLRVPVCVGVGAAFDFLSGTVSRAPVWMQHSGLEWLYRTAQEPSRLAKRYANNAMGLLRYFPEQMLAMAAQARGRTPVQVECQSVGTAMVFRISGDFAGSSLEQFEDDVCSAVSAYSHVVLDLSRTTYIGADALGSLIYLKKVAKRWNREMWLAGLGRIPAWVMRSARLGSAFRTAERVPEALRRIEPVPVMQSGGDWSFCKIGGQLIPIHAEEVPEVYRQVHEMLTQRVAYEPFPPASYGSPEPVQEVHSWSPPNVEEIPVGGKAKRRGPIPATAYGGAWDGAEQPKVRESVVG
jgi:N-acetylglucosaminyldiphosphoundecaprenol N-acetyl-beta-D-mannosaminyltransferase